MDEFVKQVPLQTLLIQLIAPVLYCSIVSGVGVILWINREKVRRIIRNWLKDS